MNPLEKYCEYLKSKDIDGLCSLFADRFIFDDRGGQDLGRPPFIREDIVSYRSAMETVFNAPGEWDVVNKGTAYGNVLFYDVCRGGITLPCVGVCRTNKEGKIVEYKVFVRE